MKIITPNYTNYTNNWKLLAKTYSRI